MSVDAPATTLSFTATRDAAVTVIQTVGRAVSSRSSVQILGGIHLRAEAGAVEVAATDMELALRARLDATVEGEGAVVVPGRVLLDIIRVLPAGEITFSQVAGESTLAIVCGSAAFKVHTYDATDFPELPSPDEAEVFAIPRAPFLETLATVGKAASRDESRPVLTGILVRLSGERLVMAATDSYRLSVKETPIKLPAGLDVDAVVPARALAEVARMSGGPDGPNEFPLTLHQNQILVGCDGVWLSALLINIHFPPSSHLPTPPSSQPLPGRAASRRPGTGHARVRLLSPSRWKAATSSSASRRCIGRPFLPRTDSRIQRIANVCRRLELTGVGTW